MFGGQLVAQALAAAQRTVSAPLRVHSLHSYFLRPVLQMANGDGEAVVYLVARVRDGSAFATRDVRALQGGRAVFHCMVSFHVPEPSSLSFQGAAPSVPPLASLPVQTDHVLAKLAKNEPAAAAAAASPPVRCCVALFCV